jgi:hypothetical protein
MPSNRKYWLSQALFILCLGFGVTAVSSFSQAGSGTVTGLVTDSTGALVPGATVELAVPEGRGQTTTSDGEGRYSFAGLAPGNYQMRVSAPGFSSAEGVKLTVAAGRTTSLNVPLKLAVVEQNVEVSASANLDVEPSSNASALTISGSKLQSLSDDPDELAQDLQLLAGPSAGPEGGSIYVDGFSNGKLPPKSAIREIRVNQNPFSAEYDRLGYGRVEILTKPGADKYHGELRFSVGDSALNARNPFAPTKPDYQRRMWDGTLGGPIGNKTSFTFQVERRDIGQAALINALVLDSGFNTVPYRTSISDPRINTEISGRLDYQLSANHTLVGRYEWEKNYQTNAGLDTFSMASRGFNLDEREHVLQLTESAVLGPGALNEIKFQYRRSHDSNQGLNSDPAVQVPGAFISGGTSMSLNNLQENRYELQESVFLSKGKHTLKFGGRLRAIRESDASGEDYNGVFTFNTLDAYRITEQGLRAGLTPAEIRAQGGGASQFVISAGNPLARVTQFDVGAFLQDDWRVGANLTISGGLRFEKQTNLPDWHNWAPRLGMAWGIPGRSPDKPFGVFRAGFGAFYDRVAESLVLDARRLDGVHQQQYLIPNPDFYPSIPSVETLAGYAQDQAVRSLAANLRAPINWQFVFSFEKQFPGNITTSTSYLNSRGRNMLRSLNINSPAPGTGVRPYPSGNVYAYDSSGRFQQSQLIANVNARLSSGFNLFGYYAWSKGQSDTDGPFTFPASAYDLGAEYARAGFDVPHRLMIGGTMAAPFSFYLYPFMVLHSGQPFNIVTGTDLNGDSIFNDRPAWATDLSRASVVQTRWGAFDTLPLPGQLTIPRNLGSSPGMVAFNLRLSRAFGFGPRTGVSSPSEFGTPPPAGGPMRGRFHGPDTVNADRRYSLTFSISARNLLNKVNLDTPVGNLSSPLFGSSTSIHGFGPGGASANRMVDLQMRFSF